MKDQNQNENNIEIANTSRILPQRFLDVAEKYGFGCDEVVYRIEGTLYLKELGSGSIVPNMSLVYAEDEYQGFDAKERTIYAEGCRQKEPLRSFKKQIQKTANTPDPNIKAWGEGIIEYVQYLDDIKVVGIGRPKANVCYFTGKKEFNKTTGKEFDGYRWKTEKVQNSIFFTWQYKDNPEYIYSTVVWGDECFEFSYIVPTHNVKTAKGERRIGQQYIFGSVDYVEPDEEYKPKSATVKGDKSKLVRLGNSDPIEPIVSAHRESETFTESDIDPDHLEQFNELGIDIPSSKRAYELAIELYL